MKGKTKKSIIVLIVLLAIGFAAVTTTLTINGVIHLGANQENFENELKFSRAVLSYTGDVATSEEADEATISENGKSITFSTKTLKNIGETATLTYDITNGSQYGAEFTGITCTVYDGDKVDEAKKVENPEYITLDVKNFKVAGETEGSEVNKTIPAGGKVENQTIKATMKKSYVGTEDSTTKQYTVQCTINASGLSQ